ncbi:MAG: GNAT family N-acetyltransferase [Chloroflexi bacterium]|nr:GNAT family N-acetyltransferase [Chloroflexota bacterium]
MDRAPVTIRIATPADNALLAELGERCFRDSFGADNTRENMTAYLAVSFSPEKQAAELADPASTFLIAEMHGTSVGYARLVAGGSEPGLTGLRPIELVRLYAVQAWIGKRVGAALMQACIGEAVKRGHDVLWLGVWEHNARARAFYGRWGFVDVGTHGFMLGNDAQTDYVMQRVL